MILKTEELVREYTGLNNDNEIKRAIDGEEWKWGRREGNSRSEHLARLASGVLSGESRPNRLGRILDRRESGTVKLIHDRVSTLHSSLFTSAPQILVDDGLEETSTRRWGNS